MSAYKVEKIANSPVCEIGEGPHWDVQRQSLYFVDLFGGPSGSLHRLDYATNKIFSANIEGITYVSFIIPVKGTLDQFAVGCSKQVLIIEWDGKAAMAKVIRSIGDVEKGPVKTVFNDGKADPRGRLFSGTMRAIEGDDLFQAPLGTFYRFSKEFGFVALKSKIGISNGLTWNAVTNKFYYVDSVAFDVKEFDYDPATGNICNERVLIDFRTDGKQPSFLPDGMTIDTEGNLFLALFGGNSVVKIDPKSGEILQDIKIPAEQVTSVAFGGPKLDILYVTTAAKVIAKPQPSPAGSLFKVTGLGVTGVEMQNFDLDLV